MGSFTKRPGREMGRRGCKLNGADRRNTMVVNVDWKMTSADVVTSEAKCTFKSGRDEDADIEVLMRPKGGMCRSQPQAISW